MDCAMHEPYKKTTGCTRPLPTGQKHHGACGVDGTMVKPFKMDVEGDDEPKWLVLPGRILRSQNTPTPKKKVSLIRPCR